MDSPECKNKFLELLERLSGKYELNMLTAEVSAFLGGVIYAIIKCDKTRVQVLMNENFDIVKMYAEKLSREMSLPYISFLL